MEEQQGPLFDQVAQRALPSNDYYSAQVPDEYAIRKALSMLHDNKFGLPGRIALNPPPPTRLGRDVASRSGVINNAYVDLNDPNKTTHVNTFTDLYSKAHSGNMDAIRQLAGILTHEAYHEQNGPAEDPAYGEQLRALLAMGAQPSELKSVEQSRAYANQMKQR